MLVFSYILYRYPPLSAVNVQITPTTTTNETKNVLGTTYRQERVRGTTSTPRVILLLHSVHTAAAVRITRSLLFPSILSPQLLIVECVVLPSSHQTVLSFFPPVLRGHPAHPVVCADSVRKSQTHLIKSNFNQNEQKLNPQKSNQTESKKLYVIHYKIQNRELQQLI